MAEHADKQSLVLEPLPRQALVNLRIDPSRAQSRTQVETAFGCELPDAVDRVSTRGDRAAVGLGPDEWLLIDPAGDWQALEAALLDALADDPLGAACDVSHNYSGFVLAGPHAREVLAKGCPLDLDGPRAAPATSAQSLLAGTRVLIVRPAADRFELRVRNSFACYTETWLADAMAEFVDAD